VAVRVEVAQTAQMARQGCLNARLDGEGRKLLDAVIAESALTARGFNRILRVARSLADLAGRGAVGKTDIATALVWRGHDLQ